MQQTVKQEEWIIYLTTNLINKKIYVGQRKLDGSKKDKTYKGSGKLICLAYAKHGIYNFNREILQYAYSAKEADEIETYYIAKLDARNPKIGYNLHIGGNSQCGENNAAYGVSDKRVRCIETNTVYKSIEHASKDTGARSDGISAVCRGLYGKSGGYQWEYVDEPIKKYENKPERVRKVYCITNDTTYDSIRKAATALDLHAISITNVCKGKLHHTGNYTFKYLDGEAVTKQKVRVKCENNGLIFESIGEASRFMRVSRSVIEKQLQGAKSKNTNLIFIKLSE
jgi:group I intron endonuclease